MLSKEESGPLTSKPNRYHKPQRMPGLNRDKVSPASSGPPKGLGWIGLLASSKLQAGTLGDVPPGLFTEDNFGPGTSQARCGCSNQTNSAVWQLEPAQIVGRESKQSES